MADRTRAKYYLVEAGVLPEVFGLAGAKCERLRYCPEGEKFSCGRFPAKA